MKKLILLSAAVVIVAWTATPAEAFGFRRSRACCDPCVSPCPSYKIEYVDKKVTCYKPVWKEREVPFTYEMPVMKEVVKKVKQTCYEMVWRDEKKTVTCYTLEPKLVEREVTRCVRVSYCCVDPYTGRSHTVRERQLVTEKVKCTVYESVAHKKDIMVKVCDLKPVTREVEVRQRVCEYETIKGVRKERYCAMVPHEMTVRVAVCVPVK